MVATRAPLLRVIVADEHGLFGELLEQALKLLPIVDVVGQSPIRAQVLDLILEQTPDVVIANIRRGQLDFIRAIRGDLRRVKVLVLTDETDHDHLVRCVQAGAAGYLLKSRSSISELNAALQAIAAGNTYISPIGMELAIKMLAPERDERRQPRTDPLSTREREVLRSLVKGISAKEIARDSGVTHKTVRNHISNMYRKLGTASRAGLVIYAIKMGIVDPVPSLPSPS